MSLSEIKDLAYQDYLNGMKYQDIADKYNIKLSTIKSWASRHWKKDCNQEKKVATKKEKKLQSKVATNMEEISWLKIENEYVTDIRKKPCTLEELAKKYRIRIGVVEKYSMENKWSEKRKNYKETIKQKAIEKSVEKEVDRITKLLEIADKASKKAEQALDEIENYIVKNKKKIKTVEYKDNVAVGKPTKEVIEEFENIETIQGPVDRQGLLFIINALRNIKDIYAMELEDSKNNATAVDDWISAVIGEEVTSDE